MTDLVCFLIIGVKYLEIESILVLLETLGFVLKVGTCHYTGEIFFRKNNGLKMGCFHHF
jgi:hypothetical protein